MSLRNPIRYGGIGGATATCCTLSTIAVGESRGLPGQFSSIPGRVARCRRRRCRPADRDCWNQCCARCVFLENLVGRPSAQPVPATGAVVCAIAVTIDVGDEGARRGPRGACGLRADWGRSSNTTPVMRYTLCRNGWHFMPGWGPTACIHRHALEAHGPGAVSTEKKFACLQRGTKAMSEQPSGQVESVDSCESSTMIRRCCRSRSSWRPFDDHCRAMIARSSFYCIATIIPTVPGHFASG
ncbi:MAG: hypothetical protein Ct9H300mP1_12830 [Planctomycetaceae bacterium]|nr:MAG: hypothetical protein Ct9H300mP1_12830 [Planctomycetaceae bacterium]